jgi:hypothetical protein
MTKPTKGEQQEEKIIVDIDGNIKEALDEFLDDWILFFFPDMHPNVDRGVKPVPLQQEFQNIITFASGKKKILDKLYQVTMKPVLKNVKEGKKTVQKPVKEVILLHTEAETSPKATFTRRVFLYAAIAIAKYNRRLTALVIYTGKTVPKNRNFFEMSFYGTILRYVFNVYVIAEQKEEDLIKSDNIFALIILALKYVIDSPNDYAKRFGFKKKLFQLLLEKDYPLEKRRKLMPFIKEILRLPTDLEKDFITFAKNITEIKMATKNKKIGKSFEARLKESDKEWSDFFTEVLYGAPVDVLLENKTAEVTAEVMAKRDAEMQGVVLHLYHTIGLSFIQIAGTVNMSVESVQDIIKNHKEQ